MVNSNTIHSREHEKDEMKRMSNTSERLDKECDEAYISEPRFPYRTVAVSTRVVTRDPFCRTQPPSPKRFERCPCRIRSADSHTTKIEHVKNPNPWIQEMPTIAETTQTSLLELYKPETASACVMADIQPASQEKLTVDQYVECNNKPPTHSKTTSFHLIDEEVTEEIIQKTERLVHEQAIPSTISHQSNQQQLCYCPPSQQLCYCPTAHHQYQTQCPCGKFHAAIITKIEAPDWSGYEACPYRCKSSKVIDL